MLKNICVTSYKSFHWFENKFTNLFRIINVMHPVYVCLAVPMTMLPAHDWPGTPYIQTQLRV